MNKSLLLALALAAALAPRPLAAADPAAVAAALALPADAARYPQAGAVVLLDESVVTLDAQGRSTLEGHRLIRILQDRAVRQLSDQRIPYRGDTQSCEVLTAVTHLPGGGTQAPEENGVMSVSDPEAAAAPFYSKARLRVISFPGVQVGAVIELRYRVQPLPEARNEDGQPFMGEMVFGALEPVLQQTLKLDVPARAGLTFELFNGLAAPAVRRAGDRVEYAWVARDRPQVVPETGMVPLEELTPRVVWTVARDRRDLGRWLFQRFQAAAAPDPAVAAKARALTAGLESPEAKADLLALFVIKEIQNVALGLGRVGYTPTPAGTILANRYADTRDKFVLFKALMEAVGLTARPLFVHEDRTRISGLACLAEYQEILAEVPLATGVRRFDLNQDRARLGVLLPVDCGRPALLVTEAGGEAVTTPASDPREQFTHAQWDLSLDAAGNLAGRITMTFGGLFDQQIRSMLFGRNQADRQVLFQTVADHLKTGARMEAFEVSDLLNLGRAPEVAMTVSLPGFACRQGDMLILDLPGLIPLVQAPVHPGLPVMKHPFLVPGNFQMTATVTLKLPEGYRVAYQPPAGELRQGPFGFKVGCSAQPGGLVLDYTISWQDAVVAPEAYPDLWRTHGQTARPGNSLIMLEKL